MATILVVPPEQARGEQEKKDSERNRRGTLRRIYVVKPNRHVTRSFLAQLTVENSKKQGGIANVAKLLPSLVVLDGANAISKMFVSLNLIRKIPRKMLPIPAQKIPTKKPEDVTGIRSDQETQKENKSVNKKKEGDGNSKKKSRTLTSTFTDRSKAACGEQIVDIDAADAGNELAAVEYIEDIYKFYKLVENESRPCDYIGSQPEISERMRAILVDWLIDVNTKNDLSLETLYLTINIMDRFLSTKTVPGKELLLVGISAMLMASKYVEEVWPPKVKVKDFVCTYTHEEILAMKKTILGKLEWNLTVPTQYVFLVRFINASIPDEQMGNMVYFLSLLGTMQYATIKYCPSMVAASAVFAARHTLNKRPYWTDTLKHHTGYSEEQLMDCGRLLVSYHCSAGNGNLQAVYTKYKDFKRGAVALIPPAKNLMSSASAAAV